MLWLAGWFAGTGMALFAGDFAPPADGPVAFRLDKIPLDADTIKELSVEVETLARGLNATTAASRRGAAQMLALAMTLDPTNTKARELLKEYQENRHTPAKDAKRFAAIRARIAPCVAWLETATAGPHGQALAACLTDVLILADPARPLTDASRETGEKGAWAAWIPNISAYESKVVVNNHTPDNPRPRVATPDTKNNILLSKAEVLTCLWQKDEKGTPDNWILAPAPLQMSATKVARDATGGPPFAFLIGPPVPSVGVNGAAPPIDVLAPMRASLRNLLLDYHKTLPAGCHISITSRELQTSLLSGKRQAISAASAVLLSAAITGREPEAIIIGRIDESGAFRFPSCCWNQLQALGNGNGQRLVLPTEAADYLSGLLAMEKVGFFLEYEVLLAANFTELLDLTAKTPDAALAKTIAQFREIRTRAGTQDVRKYLANSFVRQRLDEVVQEAPFHSSAKMLYQQASGHRPTVVSRKVLAAELRTTLEQMNWVLKIARIINANWSVGYDTSGKKTNVMKIYTANAADTGKIDATYDRCRSRMDGLARHVEKKDLDLLERMRKVTNALRNLHRGLRILGSNYVTVVCTPCSDLIRLHTELNALLDREIDDPQLPNNS